MGMLRSKQSAKRLATTILVIPVLLAALAFSRLQVCDTGTPLLGRTAYFDMMFRKVTADTNLAKGMADAFATMAEHIAREIVPMAILLPVGGVLIMSCRDANRDLCRTRLGIIRAENRTSICEVLGRILGLGVVILALIYLLFAVVQHARRRQQLRQASGGGRKGPKFYRISSGTSPSSATPRV